MREVLHSTARANLVVNALGRERGAPAKPVRASTSKCTTTNTMSEMNKKEEEEREEAVNQLHTAYSQIKTIFF